jgi:predicted nucleotidyltransferase
MSLSGRVFVGALLDHRRTETAARVEKLRGELKQAEKLTAGNACVYATGSFGRSEASPYSDLDLFIAGRDDKGGQRLLRRLDEIRIKADLIEATQKLGIPDFSGDGEYLNHYTVGELVGTLGKPEDDVSNTFTARLLLLLESRPLLGESVYHDIIEDVIGAYWRDYEDHKNEFMPAFLANDILRLWRTFCVNYEARTSTDPPEKKAKRKLKNYKLKHSRLLTCYSALIYLLAVFAERKTVSPTDAVDMIKLTPTARLEWILSKQHFHSAHSTVGDVLECYESFLADTDAAEEVLIARFLDKNKSQEYFRTANKLGDLVFEVLDSIGQKNRFHRLLLV